MLTDNLTVAKNSLLLREGIPKGNLDSHIGSVTREEENADKIKLTIKYWAVSLKLDAAIRTNLSPKFLDIDNRVSTIDEALI